MSPTPSPNDDVFYCPLCGQKHRGNLSAIREGGTISVRCAGCRTPLVVEVLAGEPVARAAEPPKPPPKPDPKTAAADPKDDDEDDEEEAEEPGADAAAGDPKAATAKGGKPAGKAAGSRRPRDPEALARARARREQRLKDEGKTAAAPPPPEQPAIEAEFPAGTKMGRYTLEEAIGQGGTGTVYRAFDPTTNRYVALKLIADGQTDAMKKRFLREVEVEANLRHPNLMPVFDRGEHLGRPYFTMELLYRPFTLTQIVTMAHSGTLSRYATLKPYADTSVLLRDVFLPVCEGLQVANVENGVLHRDLKPDNVLVDSRTLRAYVIDFGICHVLERTAKTAALAIAPTTGDAGIVGTPRFLAPEQARGAVHERTDVWGLGGLLRYCLTGEPPIAAAAGITRAELRQRVEALDAARQAALKEGDPKKAALCAEKLGRLKDPTLRTMDDLFTDAREGTYPPLPATVAPGLAAIVRKAMAPKAADRYVNPRSLASDVEAFLSGTQTRAAAAEGSSAAAVVHSVRGAVRRHLATALVGLALGALGFFLGRGAPAAGGGGGAGSGDIGAYALQRLDATDRRLDGVAAAASRFTPGDGARMHDALQGELEDRVASLTHLAASPGRDVALERARAILKRIAPTRVRFDGAVPDGKVTVEDLVRGGDPRPADVATLTLAPGEWRIVAGDVRIPLVVPLRIRDRGEDGATEPAPLTVRLPVASSEVPSGMVLVVSGDVPAEYRGPPWASPVAVPPRVAPFFMDRFEVSNAEWAEFLASYGDDAARRARVPAVDFVADAEHPGQFVVPVSSGGVATKDLPVRGVSPEDALSYCTWRSKRDGATVRLPDEAQWAVAAGVLLRHDFPGGARGLPEDGDLAAPVPVRQVKDLSPYGVAGLFGNARELVTGLGTAETAADRFLAKGAGAGDEPVEAAIRRVRVVAPGEKHPRTGLRCVRDLPAPKAEPAR